MTSAVRPLRPLRRDAADNRRRLLVAAARVFAEHGPEAGVEEIARAAGVGMGTLYRRFPTKQALVEELVGELRTELAEFGREALRLPDAEALDQLMLGTATLMYSARGCMHELWRETSVGLDELQTFRAAVAQALTRAQRAGAVRAELVPSDITVALWGLRGVIEITQAHAPDAWRRHLELTLAGFRPATALVQPAMTAVQVAALSGDGPPVK